MHTLWKSPSKINCIATHDKSLPCLIDRCDPHCGCTMNSANFAQLKQLDALMYNHGYDTPTLSSREEANCRSYFVRILK